MRAPEQPLRLINKHGRVTSTTVRSLIFQIISSNLGSYYQTLMTSAIFPATPSSPPAPQFTFATNHPPKKYRALHFTQNTPKMASYISSWTPVLQSINPFTSSPTTSPLPSINSPAPSALGSLNLPSGTGHPVLVAFVRHCGCPFAEKEVKLLGAETSKHSDLHVVIVQHSEEKETQEWFERIG